MEVYERYQKLSKIQFLNVKYKDESMYARLRNKFLLVENRGGCVTHLLYCKSCCHVTFASSYRLNTK